MPRPTPEPSGALSRRRLLALLPGVLLALWARIAVRAADVQRVAFSLATIAKLRTVGGSALVKLKGRDVLVIRDADQSVRAFDPTCTHEKCTVAYDAQARVIRCACHRSSYALDGRVLDGPAPRPLTLFPTTLDETRVIVTLPKSPAP